MLSLHEMAMLAEQEYSVESTRQTLNEIVDFFKSQPYHADAMEAGLQGMRKLAPSIIEESDAFFVDEELNFIDMPKEFQHESFGMIRFNHFVYSGRIVYPVKDIKGNVMGFCGWDKFEKPKYLDSLNYGYKAKKTTVYGMENLGTYYNNNELVFAPEGIVCSLYLRSQGLQSVALLGSDLTPYVVQILRRLGDRLVIIADNDSVGEGCGTKAASELAGEGLIKKATRLLPKAKRVQCIPAKDIDDTRQAEDGRYASKLVDELASLKNPFTPRSVIRVR